MRRLGRLLLVLGVLAALLVGAEVGVRGLIDSQVQRALAGTDLQLKRPTLQLGGGSVLAALVQGRFVDVSGTADSAEVPFEGRRVPVRSIAYDASDIRLRSTEEAVIGRLNLSGTLGWSSLSEVAGLPIASGGDGRLLVTYTVSLLGQSMRIGISAVPELDAATQQVHLTQARIDVAGATLSPSRSQQLIDGVVKPISLAVDERIRVTGLSVADDGLVVRLAATDLPVRR